MPPLAIPAVSIARYANALVKNRISLLFIAILCITGWPWPWVFWPCCCALQASRKHVDWQIYDSSQLRSHSRAKSSEFLSASYGTDFSCFAESDDFYFTRPIQCESKNPPSLKFSDIFPKRLGIFSPNFTCLLYVPIYTGLQTFVQLPATLTKLFHIKRDHRVTIMCSKCPPSTEAHAGWSHLIWHNFVVVGDNWIKICILA